VSSLILPGRETFWPPLDHSHRHTGGFDGERLPDAQWLEFIPTLTASTTNPTMGTGSALEGRYWQWEDLIIYRFFVQFGSSGASGGSGTYRLSVPEPIGLFAPSNSAFSLGSVVLFDWSVAGHKELAAVGRLSATALQFYVDDATVSHNAPFLWTNDDRLGGTVVYQTS
jgi:hypothetical protein